MSADNAFIVLADDPEARVRSPWASGGSATASGSGNFVQQGDTGSGVTSGGVGRGGATSAPAPTPTPSPTPSPASEREDTTQASNEWGEAPAGDAWGESANENAWVVLDEQGEASWDEAEAIAAETMEEARAEAESAWGSWGEAPAEEDARAAMDEAVRDASDEASSAWGSWGEPPAQAAEDRAGEAMAEAPSDPAGDAGGWGSWGESDEAGMTTGAMEAVDPFAPPTDPAGNPERANAYRAAGYMVGAFSSEAQSLDNPAYFNVLLKVVPIWRARDDGPWLYVEQAMATSPERPYRQRVYRMRAMPDGSVRSEVYTFASDPSALAGAWTTPAVFDAMSPADLGAREGCAVELRYSEATDAFVGATVGRECRSTLNGASYATAAVTLRDGQLESWDRGFDNEGNQVWGAEDGPYIFIRE